MKQRALISVLTAGAFACGFFGARYWPGLKEQTQPTLPPGEKTAPAASAGAGSSVPRSFLARQSDAKRRAAALTPPEARTIMEALQLPVPEHETARLTEVLRIWAESDPRAALEWLRRVAKSGALPEQWSVIVLTPLSRLDLAAAVAAGLSLGISVGSSEAGALLAAAAERDPAAAMAFAEKNGVLAYHSTAAFRAWLERDPAAACVWLARRKRHEIWPVSDMISDIAVMAPDRVADVLAGWPDKSPAKETALGALAALEVERDPAAALAKVAKLAEAERRRYIAPLSLHIAIRGTPAEAVALLNLSKDIDGRSGLLSELSGRLGHGDPERLLTFVRHAGFNEMDKAQLLSQATCLKPQHAEDYMALLDYKSSGFTDSASRFWTTNLSSAPEETLPMLSRMAADGRVGGDLLLAITAELGHRAPEAVERMITALPEARQAGPRALLSVNRVLRGESSDLTAFTSLPDDGQRPAMLRAALSNDTNSFTAEQRASFTRQLPPTQQMEALLAMSYSTGESAAFLPIVEEAARSGTGGENFPAAVFLLSATFSDPAAAMQWLDQLPAEADLSNARANVFSDFAEKDAAAASEWLAALPPETPRRDEMTSTLISRITPSDPERAWQWAGTIRDVTQRQSVQQSVLERWHLLDPAAAARAAGQ